jgi:hypothetical protein
MIQLSEDEDDELLDIEVDSNHMLTHLPKSKRCPICVQAKLYDAPHRKRANQRDYLQEIRGMEDPIAPLERLACDHIISRSNLGTKGETCSFVIVDRFSGIGISPSKSKDSDSVEVALRKFCGRSKAGIVSVSSDRAREIIAAVERLGFTTEPSEPRQSLHNPYAESMIRTVNGITSSVLLQSGLGHQFWPLAHRYVEWMYPITKDSPIDPEITCYEAHHGYAYEGLKIPFGSLVFIKTLDPPPFAPKGEGALFLGGELIAGQKFKGLYHVMPLSSFKDETFRERGGSYYWFAPRSISISRKS